MTDTPHRRNQYADYQKNVTDGEQMPKIYNKRNFKITNSKSLTLKGE